MPADAGTGATVRRAWLLVLAAVACAWPVGAARAEQMSEQRQREVLRAALSAFDEAVSTAQRNPGAAAEFAPQVGGRVRGPRRRRPAKCGDRIQPGQRVLSAGAARQGRSALSSRAARRSRRTRKLVANLEYARRQVEPLIRPTGQERLRHRLLFWHHHTSARSESRWRPGVLSALGWLLLMHPFAPADAAVCSIVGVVSVVLGLAAGNVGRSGRSATKPSGRTRWSSARIAFSGWVAARGMILRSNGRWVRVWSCASSSSVATGSRSCS